MSEKHTDQGKCMQYNYMCNDNISSEHGRCVIDFIRLVVSLYQCYDIISSVGLMWNASHKFI